MHAHMQGVATYRDRKQSQPSPHGTPALKPRRGIYHKQQETPPLPSLCVARPPTCVRPASQSDRVWL